MTDPTKTKAFTGKLEPEEVNYIPLSTTKNKACASCRWYIPDAPADCACYLVEAETDEGDQPILATGYCDRWEGEPPMPTDPTTVMVEAIVEALESNADVVAEAVYSTQPMMTMDDMGKALKEPSVIQKLWDGIKSFVTPTKQQSDMMVFKGKDGRNYWLAAFTNNFKDREGEILSEHAHKEFEQRLDMKLVPMPELWAWHTEGTRHGKALQVWYQDHDMFGIGVFDDTPVAQKAMAYYRKTPVKLSHGFVAPTWAFKDGVYDAYNTFEISTLPPEVAANSYTSFEEIKAMPVPETREAFIKELFGASAPDVLAKVNAKTEASKGLSELVEYKDFTSTLEKKPVVDNEVTKSLSVLYTEVVDEQTELIQFAKAQSAALVAKDAEIKAIKETFETKLTAQQKQIDDMMTLLNQAPRRASNDSSTVNTDTKLKDALPKQPDTFYGDLLSNPSTNGVIS